MSRGEQIEQLIAEKNSALFRAQEAEVTAQRYRLALQEIVSRYEERDTGQGWPEEPGPLAWAIHRVAKEALRPVKEDELPADNCPECGEPLEKHEGKWLCPDCGWGGDKP